MSINRGGGVSIRRKGLWKIYRRLKISSDILGSSWSLLRLMACHCWGNYAVYVDLLQASLAWLTILGWNPRMWWFSNLYTFRIRTKHVFLEKNGLQFFSPSFVRHLPEKSRCFPCNRRHRLNFNKLFFYAHDISPQTGQGHWEVLLLFPFVLVQLVHSSRPSRYDPADLLQRFHHPSTYDRRWVESGLPLMAFRETQPK